jgi:hypothetical protein
MFANGVDPIGYRKNVPTVPLIYRQRAPVEPLDRSVAPTIDTTGY